jgi:hypothetical protein
MEAQTYLKLRQEAEDEMRKVISNWALSDGPLEMTVFQLKTLQDRAVFSLNGALRKQWDGDQAGVRGRKPKVSEEPDQ